MEVTVCDFCLLCTKSLQSCLTLCGPMDCSPPGSSVHGILPSKNTGVGCHVLLQRIFPTQGLNPSLLHLLRWQGSSFFFFFFNAYLFYWSPYVALFYFILFLFYWRLISLQYCGGFCHTFTWISHGCTCVREDQDGEHLHTHGKEVLYH